MPFQFPSGCWFVGSSGDSSNRRTYLPYATIQVHSSVFSTASRTKVTQTFVNDKAEHIPDLNYSFPLLDGASIVSFTCRIGDRVIEGVVKERDEAKLLYTEAVKHGESAAILQQNKFASDTFSAGIGNIEPESTVSIELEYLSELENDMQDDSIRVTIPNQIAPRYADTNVLPPISADRVAALLGDKTIEVTVDIALDEGSAIQGIQSKGEHPISVSLGRTSQGSDQIHQNHLASASMKLEKGDCLNNDVILLINAKDQGKPVAVLESHPTIPDQYAVMATFIPKFDFTPSTPEIVFVIDRSESMSDKVGQLRKALRLFMKSLPIGVKFNLCGFGHGYSFLWDESRNYDETSLNEAIAYVNGIASDMGGTQILAPLKETVRRRCQDLPLNVLLLTDGEVWDQDAILSFVGEATSTQSARFFSLGIGNTVSHSLIRGVARAGGGFSQTVTLVEDLDKKVLRMLKGSLTKHIKDITAKIEFDDSADATLEVDGFEVLEKPREVLEETSHDAQQDDGAAKPAAPEGVQSADLSRLGRPQCQQTPYKLTGLFPFIRTTIYFLISAAPSRRPPRALRIAGASHEGSYDLHIPIQKNAISTSIHQLAARRLLLDFEESRGWVFDAKSESGARVADECPDKLPELVKKESVFLGTTFGVAGKDCSFVAITKDRDGTSQLCSSLASEGRQHDGMLGVMPPPRLSLSRMAVSKTMSKDNNAAANPSQVARSPPFQRQHPQSAPESHLSGDLQARTRALIDKQSFDGSWEWEPQLFSIMSLAEGRLQEFLKRCFQGQDETHKNILATLTVVAYLQTKCADEKDLWELVVEKAEHWLQDRERGGNCSETLQDQLQKVTALLQS